MKLVSVGAAGAEIPGVLREQRVVRLADIPGAWPSSVRAVLASGCQAELAAAVAALPAEAGEPAAGLRFGPPVTNPDKIICVGLNYRAHATEQNKPWPERPLLFCKTPNTLAGCTDPVALPDEPADVDFEVELAVVIGRRCRRVPAAEAMACVGGYMVANDVSARRWQHSDGQWYRSKSSDGFFPCGPFLLTADVIPDPGALHLTTDLNGERMQDAHADDLIHDIPSLIAFISASMTLQPGDIISTGTPAGVGCWREPAVFLKPGDQVTCAIEQLGAVTSAITAS